MIIITAGHVDHGKTALLHALTGTHTAHLPEEKKRGLTIDLGYAYLPLGNRTLGFIDVPGHQRFLSNMLAGTGGIEHALLVVAADEGIKPQTVEHLTLLTLLAVKNTMLVLTKADRATPEVIHKLITELRSTFPFLANAQTFITSAQTGEGIADLKAYLATLPEPTPSAKPFRYAIDRVFIVKGAGVVVTGTAISGEVKIGEELHLSTGKTVRVKAIHAQNTPSEIGLAGQRLALNLANAEKAEIHRGDWLCALEPLHASERFTVQLTLHQALKAHHAIHLYHFASHTTGKLNLLNPEAQQAGENHALYSEIVADTPLHLAQNDRLILRSGDDTQTLAGASVVEIASPKRHKRRPERLLFVDNLAKSANYPQRIALTLTQGAQSLAQISWAEQIFPEEAAQFGVAQGKWLFDAAFQAKMETQMLAKLAEYHAQHNDQLGVTKARLHRIACPEQPSELAYAFMAALVARQALAQTRGWLHLPEHRIALTEAEQQHWQHIQPIFARTNQAQWVRDVASELAMDETEMRNLLYKIGKLGYLVPIVKDRFLLVEQVEQFATFIKAFIAENGEISVNQLRDQLGYGRKLTVQLMEYFDRIGFLKRKGNAHLLRDEGVF